MVDRVWGTCNGQEVSFVQNEQGLWQAVVPAVRYGVFNIEVWVSDVAGNVTYCATIRLSFDPETMCMKAEITNIGEEFSMRDIRKLFGGETVGERWSLTEFITRLLPDSVMARVEKCEVCGR